MFVLLIKNECTALQVNVKYPKSAVYPQQCTSAGQSSQHCAGKSIKDILNHLIIIKFTLT